MGTGAPDTADSGPEVGETTANGAEDAGRDGGGGGGGDTREAATVSETAEIKFAREVEVTPALEEVELDEAHTWLKEMQSKGRLVQELWS